MGSGCPQELSRVLLLLLDLETAGSERILDLQCLETGPGDLLSEADSPESGAGRERSGGACAVFGAIHSVQHGVLAVQGGANCRRDHRRSVEWRPLWSGRLTGPQRPRTPAAPRIDSARAVFVRCGTCVVNRPVVGRRPDGRAPGPRGGRGLGRLYCCVVEDRRLLVLRPQQIQHRLDRREGRVRHLGW